MAEMTNEQTKLETVKQLGQMELPTGENIHCLSIIGQIGSFGVTQE